MEKTEKFFNQLYPEFGKDGYKKIYAILGTCFKKGFLKKIHKKKIKKFFVTIANCTYFAYAVVNYKTVNRPEPDPTSTPVANELKKYFGEYRTDRILLAYESLYWALLEKYFMVDLYGDTKEYMRFLYPAPTSSIPSSSWDRGDKVYVTAGGRTNQWNKNIYH